MKLDDKNIIKSLKYLPFYFVVIFTAIFIGYLFMDFKYKVTLEKERIQTTLKEEYKDRVKEDTQSVINLIESKQLNNEILLRDTLQRKNQTAFDIVNSIYKNNKNKSKKEILSLIKQALQDIRFLNGRGYYYILGFDGVNYFHPVFKELENRSLMNAKDSKGKYLTKEMIKLLENNDEAYIKYYWYKPEDRENQYEKIAHLRKFEPLDIFIVSSDYLDSLVKTWKEDVKSFLNTTEFKDNSHYFIIDKTTNKYEWHEQENIIGLKVSEASYVLDAKRVIDSFLNNDNSFHTYIIERDTKTKLKTSYTQIVEDWDWIVGIGFYQDDIDEYIKMKHDELENSFINYMSNTSIFLLVLLVFILIISNYLSKAIEKRFKAYNFSINRKIIEISNQEKVLAQQSKMAAMGEMIESIAHQWRQPLSVISTSATGLKLSKEFNTLEDKDLISGLDSINSSAQYLSKTIDDFRNFYNSTQTKENFKISSTLNKALNLVKTRITSNDIIIYKVEKEIEYFGIETELIQVILNILNNAIDQLKKVKHERHISIVVYKTKENICIEITDNAGGVNPKIINRIFDPYFTTKNKSIGTGIGLHMSKNILTKNFNGDLQVRNTLYKFNDENEKGALFLITMS